MRGKKITGRPMTMVLDYTCWTRMTTGDRTTERR